MTANAATSELDNFIYVLTHDMRAALRALTEVPIWIADDFDALDLDLGDDLGRNLMFLTEHGARLDRMLADLLDYSRIGRFETPHPVALPSAIDAFLNTAILPDRLAISTQYQDAAIQISTRDFHLLLGALISNADVHNPSDAPTLDISVVSAADQVTLEFTDNGPGVTVEKLDEIFDLMVSLKRRDETQGSGMGLAQVKKIAVHYGGIVSAAPAPNSQGLQIAITFPRAPIPDQN